MLRSQIMSIAEYILGKQIFHHKFTHKKQGFFCHGVQTNYDIYMDSKKSEHNVK